MNRSRRKDDTQLGRATLTDAGKVSAGMDIPSVLSGACITIRTGAKDGLRDQAIDVGSDVILTFRIDPQFPDRPAVSGSLYTGGESFFIGHAP